MDEKYKEGLAQEFGTVTVLYTQQLPCLFVAS